MHRATVLLSACVMLLIVPSCVQAPKDAGFSDVKSDVAKRIGNDVTWNRGSADDQRVADSVREMLADGLTADESVQIALLNNRHLQAEYEDLGIAQADLVQAGLLKNPVFEARYGFLTKTFDKGTTSSGTSGFAPLHIVPLPQPGAAGSGADVTRSSLELSAAMDFLDILYVPLRTHIAAERLEAAKASVTARVLDLAAEVRQAFNSVQTAERSAKLRETLLQASDLTQQMTTRLQQAGNVTDLALTSRRIGTQETELRLADARIRVVESRERLNRLMGLWGADAGWTIAGAFPPVPDVDEPPEQLESRAVASSLQLEIHRRRINEISRALGLSKTSALFPEANVGVAATGNRGTWIVGPTLAFPIPLFDQGQGRIAAFQSELRRALNDYYAAAVDLRSRVREAYARLESARDRERRYRTTILPLYKKLLEQNQAQYNAMVIDPLQLLDVKGQETEAHVLHLHSLHEYWNARIELELLLNGVDNGDVRAERFDRFDDTLSRPRTRLEGHH